MLTEVERTEKMTQISATLINTLNASSGASGSNLLGMLSGGKASSADSIFQASIAARRQYVNQLIEKHCNVSVETDTKKYQAVATDTANTKKFLEALENPDLYEEKQETRDQILKKYVSNYNKLLEDMKELGGSIQESYGKKMLGLSEKQKEALAGIGITVDKEGKWSLDESKLQKADSETIQSIFAKENSLGKQTDQILSDMKDVLTRALYIKQSMTSNYNKSGSKMDSLVQSVFNKNA